MAETAGSIKWDLDLDDKKFKSKLQSSHSAAQSFGSRIGGIFTGIGKAALKMGVVAGAAFVGFTVLSVKAAADSQAKLAQLGAVLKSTGGVAGVTSDQAIELSKSLQRVTTFSDEMVLSAENQLLTFTSIGKDVFPDATKAALDMATAMGMDSFSAAQMLGKALNNPIVGLGRLTKVGVQFTEAQKKVITRLAETGHVAEAQKLILKELHTEFGGSATAQTKTFGGALKQLGNAVDDLQESFGLAVINAVTPFVKSLANWATSKSGEDAIQALIRGFQEFTRITINLIITVWPYLIAGFNNIVLFIKNSQPFLIAYVNIWILLADVFIKYILPALQNLWKALSKDLIPALAKLWQQLAPFLIPALKILAVILGVVLLAALMSFITMLTATVKGLSLVVNFIAIAIKAFKTIDKAIRDALKGVFDTITKPFKDAFNWIADNAGKIGKTIGNLNPIKGVKIPHFASGVSNFGGGLAVVGERGPELVNLSKGSGVTPNNKLGGDTYIINLDGVMARSRADLRQIGEDIISAIDESRRAKGKATILG